MRTTQKTRPLSLRGGCFRRERLPTVETPPLTYELMAVPELLEHLVLARETKEAWTETEAWVLSLIAERKGEMPREG